LIIRNEYINTISKYINSPVVKILSGVRRCGKSTIMKMINELLVARGIASDCIFFRNYADITISDSFTAIDMFNEIEQFSENKEKCYLLLDEVQEIDGWEKTINTLLEKGKYDIYVTGSNSKLLSAEISTYLTGRYVSVPVYTLSFAEYLEFRKKDPAEAKSAFNDYLRFGGFPIIGSGNFDQNTAYQIVDGIYATVITNDITRRHKIQNTELFDRVVLYIIENIGQTFSANTIVKFLKNEKRQVSVEAVYNYLKWLSEAFIIYPCKRFDIQGKEVLKTQEKYYLADISLKYSKLGFSPQMISPLLENIVFLELKRRGYETFIGKNESKEIDFIGIKRDRKIYIQVCDRIPEKSSRETENLKQIADNHKKYVVCRDELAEGNEDGIEIIHIADFLLSKDW